MSQIDTENILSETEEPTGDSDNLKLVPVNQSAIARGHRVPRKRPRFCLSNWHRPSRRQQSFLSN